MRTKYVDSGKFVEFLIQAINDALTDISMTEQACVQVTEQVEKLLVAIGDDILVTKELMGRVD